ncbi:MAG: cupin domain-containing protein [Rhodobacteraceae bacterium]|nr:cupin domain-containing protein [Paracoccaceae bacterium]
MTNFLQADAGRATPPPAEPIAPVSGLTASKPSFSVSLDSLPVEGGIDPAYGTVLWKTLINGTAADPKEFILGVAEFGPGGVLPPHRHAPAEFYFGLDGDGVVTIDGVAHPIRPGVALYVASYAEHATVAGPKGLRIVYGFSEPSFEGIEYHFSPLP